MSPNNPEFTDYDKLLAILRLTEDAYLLGEARKLCRNPLVRLELMIGEGIPITKRFDDFTDEQLHTAISILGVRILDNYERGLRLERS